MSFVKCSIDFSSISVRNVEKNYGSKSILNNVSFDTPDNSIIGLFGLNGTGKTTLLKILLNLITRYSGEVTIFSKSSRKVSARENLVFLPEKFMPNPNLYGKEFLEIANPMRSWHETQYLLEEFGLSSGVIDRKIGTYSNGMAQKLGLVSALGTQRSLIILDEPTSGLDIMSRQSFTRVVRRLKNDFGCTILLTSHMLVDAESLCDYLVVIHDRSVSFAGYSSDFCEFFDACSYEEGFNKIFLIP